MREDGEEIENGALMIREMKKKRGENGERG